MVSTLPSKSEGDTMILGLTPILASALYIGSGAGLLLVIVVLVLLFR
jgi:hypothetical protein